MRARVLVAEDDEMQAELVRRYLEREGHTAVMVHDGCAAIGEARRMRPDLLILDIMMPGIDGLDVCRILRREYEPLPVLVLTARNSEDDLLLGLGLGADDYMAKPYSPRELMARVRTLLRRTQPRPLETDEVLHVGDLIIDQGRHQVTVGTVPVECTPGEFAILVAMAAQPDRVFSRSQLLQAVFGFDHCSTARTVDMHVMNLRKKLEPDPRNPVTLVTVFGVGYKITDPAGRRQHGP
ncbi:response regulator transcription factor [Streptacidiphilus sp. EB129]|uniref:response regulator transcription factor n=1 Tax=Streptacidiphilus sp. EB129 TaxID=3156262 RepID=UPI003511E58A